MAATFDTTLYALQGVSGGDATSASSQALTLTAGAAIGDTVVVGIGYLAGASSDTPTCTDSKGNTYTLAVSEQLANNNAAHILVSKLTVALVASDTITPVIGIARTRRVYEVKAFAGLDAVIDVTSATTATSTSPAGSLATTQAGDVVYGVCTISNTTATATWDAGYSGIATYGTSAGSTERTVTTGYRVCGASATETPQMSLSASRVWTLAAVALKATATTSQVSHPTSDVTTSGWAVTGGTGSFASAIDEANADDTDFVTSPSNPSSSVFKVQMSSLSNPGSTSGHVIKPRARYKTGSSGSIVCNWYKAAGATLVATKTQALSTSFTTYTLSLSGGEAATVDYSDIQVAVLATAS